MFKQYIAHESKSDEIGYVEEVWSEKWQEKDFDTDLQFLETNEYFNILKKLLPNGARILEGGCGQGQWVRLFTSKGYNITGVDISKNTVLEFKKRYPDYDVRQGDVFKLDFPDDTFDAYFSFGVIEHFEAGPAPIIAEAFRVLKPGGLLCVSVPYLNKQKHKNLGFKGDNKNDFMKEQDIRFYQYIMDKKELQRAVEQKGFQVMKIYPTDVGHTLKTKSSLASGIASSTKNGNRLVKMLRPILRKAWHLYVKTRPKDKFAHMIFAICRATKS